MTRISQRASSERVATHRSEPATALTAIWLTRRAALSTYTVRLHCPIFQINRISEYRGYSQGQAGDSASMRPIHLAFPNEYGRLQKDSPVAIGPVAARRTTAISDITPFRPGGRGRHGAADGTR